MLERFLKLDLDAVLYVQNRVRTPLLTLWMKSITKLGDAGMIWIIFIILTIINPDKRVISYIMIVSLALTAVISNLILKLVFKRERPFLKNPEIKELIEKPKDCSFPSGHTASSFAIAMVIWYCFSTFLGIGAMMLACLIGLSRLYVGVHYPSDILAGMMIGMAIGQLTYLCFM